jgi:hypothetical protein
VGQLVKLRSRHLSIFPEQNGTSAP